MTLQICSANNISCAAPFIMIYRIPSSFSEKRDNAGDVSTELGFDATDAQLPGGENSTHRKHRIIYQYHTTL